MEFSPISKKNKWGVVKTKPWVIRKCFSMRSCSDDLEVNVRVSINGKYCGSEKNLRERESRPTVHLWMSEYIETCDWWIIDQHLLTLVERTGVCSPSLADSGWRQPRCWCRAAPGRGWRSSPWSWRTRAPRASLQSTNVELMRPSRSCEWKIWFRTLLWIGSEQLQCCSKT